MNVTTIKEPQDTMAHLSKLQSARMSTLNGKYGNAFHDFQLKSFSALLKVNFPDRKHEDWRYTAVNRLIAPEYKFANSYSRIETTPIPSIDTYVISIINGKMELKDLETAFEATGIKILTGNDVFENQSWIESFFDLTNPDKATASRAFDFLNFSFATEPFFIDVKPDSIVTKPIEIRIIHDDPSVTFSHPLYFVRCGPGSDINIIERYIGNEASFNAGENLINSLAFIRLDKNSKLSHIKWQNLPMTQHLVYKLFVTQYRDSNFTTFAFDYGGSIVRNNVEVELEESNTYTSLHGAYLATGKQSMDHQTRINHKVPHCESHELYKGILDDQSSGAFNGKVFVHPDAQKTNAYQQNDTLVLSQHAIMNSKPQLEIYADDVKCSHGATIGQMDQQALFYLRSRGIDKVMATHILKEAFLNEIIEKIPDEHVRDFITSQMSLG